MAETKNLLLFVADALIYFSVLAALFRFRHRLGLGAFFCALGVMHFIETYLAGNLYVGLPSGIVASPGSVVLFSGKLVLLLIVYIREDAAVVRQPIYGLLFGNLLTLLMAVLLVHQVPANLADRTADLGFLHQMGDLMLWGTVLLFLDSILIILLYERSRAWLGERIVLRLWVSAAAVLTFDQIGFGLALHILVGIEPAALVGGWVAKMGAAALYAVLGGLYLRFVDRPAVENRDRSLGDVFGVLTYRERYEDLLERSSRDALTGVFDRGRLQREGPLRVARAAMARDDLTMFVIDVDHFKEFNDRFGHAAGDDMLRRIAERITAAVRSTDLVFRFGGEEFVAICPGLGAAAAVALGEHLRQAITAMPVAGPSSDAGHRVTASIGFASCPVDGQDYDALFAQADRRMYEAKRSGRDRVVGPPPSAAGARPHLVYSA